MSLNTYHSHLDFLPTNLGALSDVYGERFPREMSVADKSYQRNPTVLVAYARGLREAPDT